MNPRADTSRRLRVSNPTQCHSASPPQISVRPRWYLCSEARSIRSPCRIETPLNALRTVAGSWPRGMIVFPVFASPSGSHAVQRTDPRPMKHCLYLASFFFMTTSMESRAGFEPASILGCNQMPCLSATETSEEGVGNDPTLRPPSRRPPGSSRVPYHSASPPSG